MPFPSPGDLPSPGIEPGSPALQADALPPEPPRKTLNTGVNCANLYIRKITQIALGGLGRGLTGLQDQTEAFQTQLPNYSSKAVLLRSYLEPKGVFFSKCSKDIRIFKKAGAGTVVRETNSCKIRDWKG